MLKIEGLLIEGYCMKKMAMMLLVLIGNLIMVNCAYLQFGQKTELQNVDLSYDTLLVFEKSHLNAYGNISRITMQGDGLITYEWVNSASFKNVIKRRASKKAVQRVISSLEGKGFFELKDRYLSSDPDCQQLTSSQKIITMLLKAGGKTKQVRHYHGCSGFLDETKLKQIEKYIERIFKLRK